MWGFSVTCYKHAGAAGRGPLVLVLPDCVVFILGYFLFNWTDKNCLSFLMIWRLLSDKFSDFLWADLNSSVSPVFLNECARAWL